MSVSDRRDSAAGSDPYRELFERSADAILIIEGDTFVDCNEATVQMLRYDNKAQLLETHPSELSPPTQPDGRDSREKADEMIALAFEKGSHRFEWDHVRATGEVFPVEVLLTAVERSGRGILHVVWRDITERKRLEESLRNAQRMESLGRLAGGIAHDFNNLLVAIVGNADLLARSLQDDPERLAHVREIHAAGDRAASLVRQLLAFSRKQEVQPQVFDLSETVRELEAMLRRLIGEHLSLRMETEPEPVPVLAGPGQVEQIIINLATNARDAMPEGGTLTIRLRRLEVPVGSSDRALALAPGRWAELTVSDTGVGMDAATAAHAFDPFFTTKHVGEGTGLGLASVYAIAQRWGGSVRLQSAPGSGTTVFVTLPVTEGLARIPSEAAEEAPSEPAGETILMAEDDPAVSELVVRVLRGAGYRVLSAPDGKGALDLWRAHRGEVDLLFTDVVMPGMGGVDLARALRAAGFAGPVLFASGYTNQELRGASDLGGPIDMLDKPFGRADLLSRVRQSLAAGRAQAARPAPR